jgi:hypothetical protein
VGLAKRDGGLQRSDGGLSRKAKPEKTKAGLEEMEAALDVLGKIDTKDLRASPTFDNSCHVYGVIIDWFWINNRIYCTL